VGKDDAKSVCQRGAAGVCKLNGVGGNSEKKEEPGRPKERKVNRLEQGARVSTRKGATAENQLPPGQYSTSGHKAGKRRRKKKL